MPLPGTKARPWYVKETWPAIAALLAGLAGAGFALVGEALAQNRRGTQLVSLAVALVAVVVLGGLKIAQSKFKDAQEDKRLSPNDLRGCLQVIHRMVAGKKGVGNPPEGWLRVTLHRVDGATLEQSLEYVGSDDRNRAGRRFPITSGLIGVVARKGEMRAFDRPRDMPFTEWCDQLVEHYGMTRDAAKAMRDDRFSFLGVPINNPGGREVRAVVYFDAGQSGFFDKETADPIVFGCEGLAAWIDDHYYTNRS